MKTTLKIIVIFAGLVLITWCYNWIYYNHTTEETEVPFWALVICTYFCLAAIGTYYLLKNFK